MESTGPTEFQQQTTKNDNMVQFNMNTASLARCHAEHYTVAAGCIDIDDHCCIHKDSFTRQLTKDKNFHDTHVVHAMPSTVIPQMESQAQMMFGDIVVSVNEAVESADYAISRTIDQINEQLRSHEPVHVKNEAVMKQAMQRLDETERKVREFRKVVGDEKTRGNESY
jgi:hypothetical protein